QGEGLLADLVNGFWLRRSVRSPLGPKTKLSSVYAYDIPSFRLRSVNCKGDFIGNIIPMSLRRTQMPNGGVDAAARIRSSIAERIKLRNTLPPLACNDLL